MKKYIGKLSFGVLFGFFAVVCVMVVWKYATRTNQIAIVSRSLSDSALSFFDDDLKALTRSQIALEKAQHDLRLLEIKKKETQTRLEIEQIPAEMYFRRAVYLGISASVCISLIILSACGGAALYSRVSFVLQTFNGASVYVSKKVMNSPAGKSWLMYMTEKAAYPESPGLVQLKNQMMRFLREEGKRSPLIDVTPGAADALSLPEPPPPKVPTFRELLENGGISQGQAMILGYNEGIARRGSFLDIYSAAVAGESGSGKTSTMLFLIGSGLLSCRARFSGIDPHYPHQKSLGFKTKALWEAGLMRMATHKDDILDVLTGFEAAIDNRLKGKDRDETPLVLVIDELYLLSKTTLRQQIVHTMERISTEGRKCAVYLLASSQVWLAKMFDNSAWRDTLTSAYVHRIKPKEAQLLLQDRREVERVRNEVRKPGEVLFLPVNDASEVCQIPYTEESDMKLVVELLGRRESDPPKCVPPSEDLKPPRSADSEGLRGTPRLPKIEPEFVQKDLNAMIESDKAAGLVASKNEWVKAFAARYGLNASTVDSMTRDVTRAGSELWARVAECLIAWRHRGHSEPTESGTEEL